MAIISRTQKKKKTNWNFKIINLNFYCNHQNTFFYIISNRISRYSIISKEKKGGKENMKVFIKYYTIIWNKNISFRLEYHLKFFFVCCLFKWKTRKSFEQVEQVMPPINIAWKFNQNYLFFALLHKNFKKTLIVQWL